MSPVTSWTDSDGCTASTSATSDVNVMGANAVFGSNGKFLCRYLFAVSAELTESRSVIAVSFGIGDRRRPGCPAGTATIVDGDALPEGLAERLTDDPRHGIGRASGREIDDQRDRTAGIILSSHDQWHRHNRHGGTAEKRDELAALHPIAGACDTNLGPTCFI